MTDAAALPSITMPSGQHFVRPVVAFVWTWDGMAHIEAWGDPSTGRPAPSKAELIHAMRTYLDDIEADPSVGNPVADL